MWTSYVCMLRVCVKWGTVCVRLELTGYTLLLRCVWCGKLVFLFVVWFPVHFPPLWRQPFCGLDYIHNSKWIQLCITAYCTAGDCNLHTFILYTYVGFLGNFSTTYYSEHSTYVVCMCSSLPAVCLQLGPCICWQEEEVGHHVHWVPSTEQRWCSCMEGAKEEWWDPHVVG